MRVRTFELMILLDAEEAEKRDKKEEEEAGR